MGTELSGARALVTGASSGIGAALAERLAAEGAVVGICARRADRLAEVLERCRVHQPACRSWTVDLADPAQVDDLAARAADELGGLDLLVNNAGIPKRRHATRLDIATVEAVTAINFLSPARLTLALLPHLCDGGGTIVNVSSVAATLSSPGEAAYDASKAALAVWSEALAIDLWDEGVRVLTVYPGVVDTELFTIPDNDPMPAGVVDPVPVDEAVDAIVEALRGDSVEVYVPAYFKDLAVAKATDTTAFLEGAAAFVRDLDAGTAFVRDLGAPS